jgi:hypothetical protein
VVGCAAAPAGAGVRPARTARRRIPVISRLEDFIDKVPSGFHVPVEDFGRKIFMGRAKQKIAVIPRV